MFPKGAHSGDEEVESSADAMTMWSSQDVLWAGWDVEV